jgi:hypothetical protein
MTDTTHPHPLDAAIEAIKPLAECEIEEYAPFAQDSDIVRFPFTIAEVRAARSALPAITAYREGMGKPTPPAPTLEGWGKRVEVTVLGDREEGSGIDQMNQIADRMAMKPRAD